MADSLDTRKQSLIVNVVNFLQDELVKGNLNDERKESLEVAIQCLETAFELDNVAKDELADSKVDLLSLFKANQKIEVSEEHMIQAEESKNKGNTNMKNQEYTNAVLEYTKAIQLNPHNAVYYCNRAAAYSRLERHLEAIHDCNEAIKLDPTYGKAYGRLGIAYSNLDKYEDARKAYLTALKYDPSNVMYQTNLKLAEERLTSNMESAAPPEHRPLDISQFINNPNLINMATQMLSDPNFRNLMSNIMSMNQGGGDSNLDVLFQAGQTLASRMQTVDPNFVDCLRRSLDPQNPAASTTATNNDTDSPGSDKDNEKNDNNPNQ